MKFRPQLSGQASLFDFDESLTAALNTSSSSPSTSTSSSPALIFVNAAVARVAMPVEVVAEDEVAKVEIVTPLESTTPILCASDEDASTSSPVTSAFPTPSHLYSEPHTLTTLETEPLTTALNAAVNTVLSMPHSVPHDDEVRTYPGQIPDHAAQTLKEAGSASIFVPDIMLVDISGLGYAAMYSPLGKLNFEGLPTGGIHGAIASLFARMAQRPNAVPVILWDNKAHWRHEMFAGYKALRGADPEKREIRNQYRLQVPYIQMLLSIMGIPQVSCGESEADDLAGAICRELDTSWFIELVSRDGDWWQQLDERTVWYSPVHRKGLSLAALSDPANGMKDGHFLSTNEYLEAKALAGDTSDEIPGILGVGLLTACKIIRAHGTSIREFWAQVDSGHVTPKGVVMTRMAEASSRAIFERNVKLMDWREAPPLDMRALSVTAGKVDYEMLEAEASCLGLKKLTANAREALKPWKNGWGSALDAVDAALHHRRCQQVVKPAGLVSV